MNALQNLNVTGNVPSSNYYTPYTPPAPYTPPTYTYWMQAQVEAICLAYEKKVITKAEARKALKKLAPFALIIE